MISVFHNATDEPCQRCIDFVEEGGMRREPIMPLPKCPPRAVDTQKPCCHDCASADTLVKLGFVPTWGMARVAVANDRQELLRLPGVLIGLSQQQLMLGCVDGDLERHQDWLSKHKLEYHEVG